MADDTNKPAKKTGRKPVPRARGEAGTRSPSSASPASSGKTASVRKTKKPASSGGTSPAPKKRPTRTPKSAASVALPQGGYKYDACFSFAGENRAYVQQVAKQLKRIAPEISFFYDNFEADDLWGKDLPPHFDSIYQRDSRFCVMFISTHYARKEWTNLERRSALARTLTNKGREYILPVYFDDTQLPGVPRSIGDRDGRKFTPLQIARTLVNKLKKAIAAENIATPMVTSTAAPAPPPKPRPRGGTTPKPKKPKPGAVPAASSALSHQGRVKTSGDWMLLDGEFYLAKKVTDNGAQIEVHFLPRDNEERARLLDLDPKRGHHPSSVSFAHGQEAAQVDVREVVATTSAGKSALKLTLHRQAGYGGHAGSDEATERQARRLLLCEDEAPTRSGAGIYSGFYGGGSFSSGNASQAAFPQVWKRLAGHAPSIGDLLRCARLQALFDLKTGGTVEHVYDLELGPIQKGTLKVKFRGRRRRSYTGEAIKDVKFEGTCDLTRSD